MEQQKNTTANRSRMALPLILLALLLLVPAYWLLAGAPAFLTLEKRYPAAFPAATEEALLSGKWGADLDRCLTDRMPLRNFFVGVYAYAARAVGLQGASGVYVDRAGNLIDAPERLNEERAGRNIAAIRSFAETAALPLTVLPVPSAGYAAGERLPDWIRRGYPDARIMELLDMGLSDAGTVIDLRQAMLESPITPFYGTDHHWNDTGVYLAYAALCRSWGMEPLARSALQETRVPGFYGATYAKSGLWLHGADELRLLDAGAAVRVRFSDREGVFDSPFFADRLSEPDKYPVFLDGNHPLTVIETIGPSAAGTLLIVKDSYGNSLAPLLAAHFQTLVIVDLRYYKQEASALAAEYGADALLVLYAASNLASDANIAWLR